ncbi:MAG TPA: insulinase family protein [Vicinamibacterales bacterium]|nr:insulinase family protein [Vicinamibacterales bacterium]
MTLRLRTRVLLVAVAAVAAVGLLSARQQRNVAMVPETAPLSDTLPVDPQITVGKLPNGLRYYIRANHKPEQRAELRLVVNAGSVLEDESQRGLAHMCEHLAFDGTKHFPEQDIIAFMQALGMQFGPHVNAYTSFDETVYQLQIPTGNPAVIDRALLILEDWAHDVTFDPQEIDKERKVVMEEWRLGRGADARLQDKEFPVLLEGSKYAERLPIGQPPIIEGAKPEEIKRFYHDWYRTDLMGVIAVGDFDRAAVEQLVKAHFGALPAPTAPKPRPVYTLPDHKGTRYSIATDKEATQTEINVYALGPARDQSTLADYRQQQILDPLFTDMLSSRFEEMSQKPDAPFIDAQAGRNRLVRTVDSKGLAALVADGGAAKGLDALFTETERVAKYGFTASELARAKQKLLKFVDQAVTERQNEPSAEFADEFTRAFTTDEPIPGIVYEAKLYHRFIPGVTLDDVNKMAKDWAPDHGRVVVVSAPEKAGVPVPTEAELTAAIRAASSRPLQPYVDTAANTPLIETAPAGGSIAKTSVREADGLTEWELSNGVKVVLKPTTFKEDEILVRGFSLGGTSLASDADYTSAETAAQVVAAGGVGKLNAVDLDKALAGKVARATPFIGDTDAGVNGAASKDDLETLFQLIYLRFTAPRADPQIFNIMTSQAKTMLANQTATPEFAFNDALRSALSQNHPRARALTPARISEMSLDRSMAFYKDRFADASAFTFVIVGSFDLATVKPLVEKYLAGLPSLHRAETVRDVGIRPPTTVVTRRVEKGVEPKSQAAIVFTGPFEYTPANRVVLRAMTMVLESRLLEILREDLGGTYSVSVTPTYTKLPVPQFSVSIEFGCSPARTDELVKRVFEDIEALKNGPLTMRDITDTQRALQREFETNSKQNGYWLNQIALRYEYGEDPGTILLLPSFYIGLTPQAIQEAARAYLNTNDYVQVTLFPEKKS